MNLARLAITSLALLTTGLASAAVRTVGPVGCMHTDLASAVLAADAGDTLRISRDYDVATNVRIEKSLTLVGGLANCFSAAPEPGVRSTLASAQPAPSRVLDVRGADVSVELVNLRLTGALNQGGLGIQDGAEVRVAGVRIDGNSSLFGGGVWIRSGSALVVAEPTLDPSLPGLVVDGNEAPQGGGIYVSSNASLSDSINAGSTSIASNHALDLGAATGRGGGLYIQSGGWAELRWGAAFDNHAREGGGAWVQGHAAGALPDGVHDLWLGSSLHLNSATAGGGLYVAAAEETRVQVWRVAQNHAAATGGGIQLGAGAQVTVGELDLNTSAGVGGGAYQAAGLLRVRVSLADNQAASDGGGIHAIGGDRDFDGGVRIEGNQSSAGRGGALFDQSGGTTRLPGSQDDAGACAPETPCRVIANSAAGDGGAFLLDGAELSAFSQGTAEVAGLHFEDNHSGGDGGAIHATGAQLYLSSSGIGYKRVSRWLENSAAGAGGAIALQNAGLVISHADFGAEGRSNTAQDGGAIAVAGQGGAAGEELRASNVRFEHNQAVDRGGALWLQGAARASLKGFKCDSFELPIEATCASLSHNTAAAGGALAAEGARLVLDRVHVARNTPASSAVAALVLDAPQPGSVIGNSLLSDNGGDAIELKDDSDLGSTLVLERSTFAGNGGSAWRVSSGTDHSVSLTQVLVWTNSGGALTQMGGSAVFSATCSAIEGGLFGALDIDPEFITSARGDWRLPATSPVAATCSVPEPAGVDLDGRSRASPDAIGAFAPEGASVPLIFAHGFESN